MAGKALDNSRAGKRLVDYYDGHDRAPGAGARDRSRKWRLWRRRTKRWLRDLQAAIQHTEVAQ
ncbi:MAG TPA: hypothetical protein VNI83_02270 [Vicinamibacterales bacterium]|nr:hypothetical protein [Vicinamibacterales bacterium]